MQKEEQNPMKAIVDKFAEKGFNDAENAFDMLDDNGDGVLTIKEIQDGMKFHNILLSDEEWETFRLAIDKNGDGVLDLDEWLEILTPKIDLADKLYKIMGDINIKDPLVLEERILDLKYRNRHLE